MAILVVDDNASVRRVVTKALERAGYRVLAASRPSEALALTEDAADPVELLLVDLVMPEMSGTELAARLRARRGALPVLYVSGRRAAAGPGTDVLEKPFRPAHLVERVRGILGAPAPPGTGGS